MLPHPAWQIALQFHNTYLGWTKQCNNYKIACINMLWQHDFWMKPKNFVVGCPHRQQSMKVKIPGTLCRNFQHEKLFKKNYFVTLLLVNFRSDISSEAEVEIN